MAAVPMWIPISPIYNIASGTNYSLEEILIALQEVRGIDFDWIEVGNNEDADLIGYTKAKSEGFTAKKNNVLVAKPPKKMKNNGFLEPR